VETSAISYRVADFLKQHPPFQAMADEDLLELASRGRVRFHEANEYILWQGEPHKSHVFVIQQGTVSLWDEADGRVLLRDVRGAGDLLGIERFSDAPWCLYSARSASDVVIYSFPAFDFEELVLKYPHSVRFVEAYDTVTAEYQPTPDAKNLHQTFLHSVTHRTPVERLTEESSLSKVAQVICATGSNAVPVVDENGSVRSILTADTILTWVASGGGSADQPIKNLRATAPPVVGPGTSVTDAMILLADAGSDAIAVTADGTPAGPLLTIATARDIGRVFGDQPLAILKEIRLARTVDDLRDLNHRSRAVARQWLSDANALGWVSAFLSRTDTAILTQILGIVRADVPSGCWAFCGASGRGESLTRHIPQLMLIVDADSVSGEDQGAFSRVGDALSASGYMPRAEMAFDQAFYVASRTEWLARYENWVRDPVLTQMYQARLLFDLRGVHGNLALWREVQVTVNAAIDASFLHILSNDCLTSLPPLTFFQDAVIDESGEQATVFRLEHSALQPLVDVGRVFGMAARKVLGTTTPERLASARALLPEHESIFREAADTWRILAWQQAKIGIEQDTTGSELPPALLSRHDRHVLKSGFRSILRLLEFTGNSRWIDEL
jgi:CBS domain-containing protein